MYRVPERLRRWATTGSRGRVGQQDDVGGLGLESQDRSALCSRGELPVAEAERHEVIGFGGIERVGAQPFSKLLQGRFIGTER